MLCKCPTNSRLLPQVLELLIIVLHHNRRDSEEKWKRLSRQVTDRVSFKTRCSYNVNLDGLLSLVNNHVHVGPAKSVQPRGGRQLSGGL